MEHIVIVDNDDNFIGEEEKGKCHDGDGILHRGFLVTVFNNKGELLLTQRSEKKRLWPGYWDGTVASHVMRGEDYLKASRRRLEEEVELTTDNIKYLFKFHYKAFYKNMGTEHEICAVTMVKDVNINRLLLNSDEISGIKSISPQMLMKEFKNNGNKYTPWLILAIKNMSKQLLI
jgi:isopentenyl-diphosphate delta-isomerase